MDTEKLPYPEPSESIIGAAMKLLDTLKLRLNENVDENALVTELRKRGHHVEQAKRFEICPEGLIAGTLAPDFIVDDLVGAEPTVAEGFTATTHVTNDWPPRHYQFASGSSLELHARRSVLDANCAVTRARATENTDCTNQESATDAPWRPQSVHMIHPCQSVSFVVAIPS